MELDELQAEYHRALTGEWREMPEEAQADIPEHLRRGLDGYFLERVMPGAFLRAVLTNDLAGAAVRANPPEVMLALPRLMQVLYTYAPGRSYGVPELVDAWVTRERE